MEIPQDLLERVPAEDQPALRQLLALDPRPGYQQDPERVYGLDFHGLRLKFRVDENGVLTVSELYPLGE